MSTTKTREFNVVFSIRQGSFSSRLIRIFQRTKYSHVAIVFHSNFYGREMVYEAMASGVRLASYDNWLASGNLPVHLINKRWSQEKFRKVFKEKVGPKLGKPYGFWTLVGIAFGSNELGMDGDKSFICSEVAYDFLEEDLEDLVKMQDKVTPKDMYEALT